MLESSNIRSLIGLPLLLLFLNSSNTGGLGLAEMAAPEPLTDRLRTSAGETSLRVAVVGFGGDPAALAKTLSSELSKSEHVSVVERTLIEPAVAGIGYDGSINMSRDEARRLGSAIGCDFFVIGKAEVVTRSETVNQAHQEALVAVMIVDGRGGTLAVFDLVTATADSSAAALNLISRILAERASGYRELMLKFRASRLSVAPPDGHSTSQPERIEDMPAEGSPRSAGFKPPEFLNRVKPDYTAEAERADISATVEANVILRANAEIGDIEILRWAGFGLDEAALRAIRQLQFKPATRDGRPVSIRALIRYNFRRVEKSTERGAGSREQGAGSREQRLGDIFHLPFAIFHLSSLKRI